MAKQIIIGITGTLGAGKGEIVNYLVSKKGFIHYSVSDYLTQQIKKKKLEVNRENMRIVANDIRSKKGSGFIVDYLYKKAKKTNKNSIIESIRTLGEVEALQKKGNFFLFAVDADSKIRFKRIKKRKSEKDHITFKEFIKAEKMEMDNKDISKQNLKGCIKKANYKFTNDKTISDLHKQIDKTIKEVLTKS